MPSQVWAIVTGNTLWLKTVDFINMKLFIYFYLFIFFLFLSLFCTLFARSVCVCVGGVAGRASAFSRCCRWLTPRTAPLRELGTAGAVCLGVSASGSAQTLTDIVLSELNKVGLDCSKILSQVYDGASVMSGRRGGVQQIL